jgi:peptidoglycan/LPS O-acetylase OafA/YrhL
LVRVIRETHLDYLDGWRGISILFLLAGHFLLWPSIAGHTLYTGRLGVECFFVLSGRLMAEILFIRKIPFDVFYWRRASRILPAFWIFIGGIIFVASFATSFQVSLLDVVSALTFTINYRSFATVSQALSHIWSLCVEEHAYLLLGLVAVIHRRFAISALLVLAAVTITCVLNGAIQTFVFDREYYEVYWRSDVRMASVLMSAVLYLYLKDIRTIPPVLPIIAGVFGCVLIVLPRVPDPIKYSIGTLSLAFALVTISCTWSSVTKLLSHPTLTYFGIWSFSLYLWQQPFALIQPYHSKSLLLITLVMVSLTSFYFLERPARRFLNGHYKHRPRAAEAARSPLSFKLPAARRLSVSRMRRHYAGMTDLTDTQLGTVMDMARTLPVEKRDLYLQRIAAMLSVRGRGRFNDADVADAAKLAMAALVQTPTAA